MIEYTLKDVLKLEGISYPSGNSVRIECPFCKGKKIAKNLGITFDNEKFNCFSCGISGRGATQFYAYMHNITTKAAFKEINAALGISNSQGQPVVRTPRNIPEPEIPVMEVQEADLITRDKTYSEMLSVLTLSKRHLEDLLSRGFTEDEIVHIGYKTYPKMNAEGITPEYFNIPKKLYEKGCTFKGVPGFFKTKGKGYWSLCNRSGGILVPYRSFDNKIEGFQMRKNDEDLIVYEDGTKENKYSWIASGRMNEGCRATTKIHFACDFKWNGSSFEPILLNDSIILTEGAMKGDLSHAISGFPFIAVPGVTSALEALRNALKRLKSIGLKKVYIAYDMDRLLNIHVLKGLAKIKEIISAEQLECEEMFWSTEIVDLHGNHSFIDVSNTFIFNLDTLQDKDDEDIKAILKDCSDLGRKNVLFAMKNSKETEAGNQEYVRLKKLCEANGIKCNACFWSLRLKGIDDYYAYNNRGIQYV